MAVVKLDRLTKLYDRTHAPAADAVSLDIKDGEFMVLLGPSGCGKTTTLRMIAGLESISSGRAVDRRQGRQRRARQGTRHRHGVPVLRALSAYEREGKSGLRAAPPRGCARGDRAARHRRRGDARPLRACSIASRTPSPAASVSAWRWDARSCAIRKCSCSTNRCRISMPPCACRHAARLPRSIAALAQR